MEQRERFQSLFFLFSSIWLPGRQEEFIAEEWDIRDKQHESRWKK